MTAERSRQRPSAMSRSGAERSRFHTNRRPL
jgi:hypothetical protein